MLIEKPFSPSCEENKEVILNVIQPLFASKKTVLEIASGTGQHAVYFCEKMPFLQWQTSDLTECHSGIGAWIKDANLTNVMMPIPLNVSTDTWPSQSYDVIYSANSFHIMSQQNVDDFFKHVTKRLNPDGLITLYGPFNYQGNYTSESNQRFDQWLKSRNPDSCIKDFEWCQKLAQQAGLQLLHDIEMPQNNRILCWKK